MTTAALIYLSGIAWIVFLCATAPEGYEDDRGFHYGKEPNAR